MTVHELRSSLRTCAGARPRGQIMAGAPPMIENPEHRRHAHRVRRTGARLIDTTHRAVSIDMDKDGNSGGSNGREAAMRITLV